MNTIDTRSSPTSSFPKRPFGIRSFLILWPLFFAICFGLGYPTLHRYNPRITEGMSDTPKYYAITTGADTSGFKELFRCRVLVPYVARPFYWFAQVYIPGWDPAFFGLLVSASIFCATTACLIVSMGQRLFDDASLGLVGAMLYLLNFTISNFQLAGLVDAGEACFLAAVTWSLLTNKWWLLPLWGLLGAAAKETFMPFSVLFALTWWLLEWRRNKAQLMTLKWVIGLAVVSLAMVLGLHAWISGHFQWPWQIAEQARASVNFFVALRRCLTEHSFWYVFIWLLPLGLIRLKAFPKAWLTAAVVTSGLALLLGTYNDSGGTVGRAVFNIIGPLLSLSVALLITPGKATSIQPQS